MKPPRSRGLFVKYVLALVGLVVFVLTVNGALEVWISYRETKTTLTTAMSEKAEETARRIDQAIAELERQVSSVTRASIVTVEQRRIDYARLLGQQPSVIQLFQIDGNGREVLRLDRATVSVGSNEDFSRDLRFTQTLTKRVTESPVFFRDGQPMISMSMAHSGFNAGATVAEIDLQFLPGLVGENLTSRISSAYVIDQRGRVLASGGQPITPGRDFSRLPQVAALLVSRDDILSSGTDIAGNSVLTSAAVVPKLGWFVILEQSTSQALAPIRDLLIRIGVLLMFGFAVAILAGTLLARRMLIPIKALRAGASRLGNGDFGHRINVKTSDELADLADQFNGMAGQLSETYANLEAKVEARTRDLAQSNNELRVLEEVGRAVSSSLKLDAVLPTVATHALEMSRADAVLIYSYDPGKRRFELAEAKGIQSDTSAYRSIDRDAGIFGEAAVHGEPIAISDLANAADPLLRDTATSAGFGSVLIAPLVDQEGILGALIILRQQSGPFSNNVIGLMQTFAHQAVLAMRNARLFHEVDQKGRELASAHDTVQQQANKLQEQTVQLRDWNKSLETRVEKQLGEIERIRRLERFLAPQVAQLIASNDGHDTLLDSHRREITVVFCDLRGFTAFTESTEPEEAMNVLREYHAALGELIFRYEGTLDRYAGDGVLVLFNAPIQFDDHTKRAVKMAVDMQKAIDILALKWRNRGHNLGFGIGIALGYATLGQIGFEQRLEYAAIGSVTNLASRLCDEAKAGQIVVSQRAYGMVDQWAEADPLVPLQLKGFNQPVPAVSITGWREEPDTNATALGSVLSR